MRTNYRWPGGGILGAMVVATLLSLVGLAVVVLALLRDEPLDAPGPPPPEWDPLPTPSDVARTSFPLSFPGYDPASVEVALDALASAYADLLAVAPPQVIARARHRAELRTGRTSQTLWLADDDLAAAPGRGHDGRRGRGPIPVTSRPAAPEAPSDAEALRVEAVIGGIGGLGDDDEVVSGS